MHHTQNNLFKRNKFDTMINRHQKKTRSIKCLRFIFWHFERNYTDSLLQVDTFYIAMINLPGGGSDS